ncbi:hypothetical protein BV22DRAFT_1074614 [Leucogyrophana mollusca]|uniref:Uncharacterized protein n=1 Tax=Leucogyrophana mollusca TaxID=85980 RepID=A0ACB8B3T5_9AGAM|nr:hypothetical protein BV22DRAFT_1074614 [Leucogyrophana mollusca]
MARGSAVISESIRSIGVEIPAVRPWIERDVDEYTACPIDDMLEVLLYRCRDTTSHKEVDKSKLLKDCLKAVLPIANGTSRAGHDIAPGGIKAALEAYTTAAPEDNRYGPFAVAANTGLSCLSEISIPGIVPAKSEGDPTDILFKRNDPKELHQKHQGHTSARKPDVVAVSRRAALAAGVSENKKDAMEVTKKPNKRGGNTYDGKHATFIVDAQQPPNERFSWKDVRCAVEFKALKKNFDKVPHKYRVVDYEEPSKPFLSVEYLRSLDPPDKEEELQPGVKQDEAPAQRVLSSQPNAPIASSGGEVRRSSRIVARKEEEARRAVSSTNSATGKGRKRASDNQLNGEPSNKRSKTETKGSTEKEPKPTQKPPAIVQCGLYAAEMFASHLGLQHVFNLVVIDDILYVWYFDRQRAIQCSGFNFVQDLPRFLVLLLAMQRFTDKQWGLNEMFESTETATEFPSDDCGVVDLLFNMDPATRATHFGLRGRATNVLSVTSEALLNREPIPDRHITGDEYVAKIFWAEESRESEPSIIQKAHALAAQEERVRGHIPEPVWWEKFTDTSTATIRKELGVGLVSEKADRGAGPRDNVQVGNPPNAKAASHTESVPGSRVLWIIVFRKLRPITELPEKEFLRAWWEIVLCHYELWKEGIHHRDISESNLMYYRNAQGVAVGVLNDYDLSSTTEGRQGDERTGTIPFMSVELLRRPALDGHKTHEYYHDAESLIWVLAWVTLHYEHGTRRPRQHRPLEGLLSLQAVECSDKKTSFMVHGRNEVKPPPSQQGNWEVARGCLKVLATHYVEADGSPVVLAMEEAFEKWLFNLVKKSLG